MILREKYCLTLPHSVWRKLHMPVENVVLAFSYILLASYYLLLGINLLIQ